MSKVKTTTVSPSQFLDEEFKDPSRWYITDCMGDRVYFHCRDRSDSQTFCNEQYGVGKYTIKTNKTIKSKGELSAKGYIGSKSRAGSRPVSN